MYHASSPESIQNLFASIATNYDKANTIFSFGMHKRWNQTLIKTLKATDDSEKLMLDLCAGTGDIGLGYLKRAPHARAILLDFCPQMLAVAEKKGESLKDRFKIMQADAQAIPLEDASIDIASISYGIRNVKEPRQCFKEVYRVLKPGGCFGILELTRPSSKFLALMHGLYIKTFLPILGMITAKNFQAYRYLSSSITQFASPAQLREELLEAGFKHIKKQRLLGGIATILYAEKS